MSATADVTSTLKEKFPQVADRASLDHPAFNVPPADVVAVLTHLRGERFFDFLVDVTAIDAAEGSSPRFTVVHHLFSTTTHNYIRIASPCADDANPTAPSVVALWPAADWHERECFDMFGIKFKGHPDLR